MKINQVDFSVRAKGILLLEILVVSYTLYH